MQRPPVQAQDAMKQARAVMDQLGIDLNIAVKVLLVAVLSGVLGLIIDKILGFPTKTFFFTFLWILAALNGPTYAFFKGKEDLAGLVMSAVAGIVTFLVYFVIFEIITGDMKAFPADLSDFFEAWVDSLNVGKSILSGLVAGLVGFGWFALLRRLPAKILPG
jgi:hypothetical protein